MTSRIPTQPISSRSQRHSVPTGTISLRYTQSIRKRMSMERHSIRRHWLWRSHDCLQRNSHTWKMEVSSSTNKYGQASSPGSRMSSYQGSTTIRGHYRPHHSPDVHPGQTAYLPKELFTKATRINWILSQHWRQTISWYHSGLSRCSHSHSRLKPIRKIWLLHKVWTTTKVDNTVSCLVIYVLRNRMASRIIVDAMRSTPTARTTRRLPQTTSVYVISTSTSVDDHLESIHPKEHLRDDSAFWDSYRSSIWKRKMQQSLILTDVA